MVELAITLPTALSWTLPVVFGLGTGLPILIIAWVICYGMVSTEQLTQKLHHFERYFRYVCAVLFLVYGIYLGVHLLGGHDHNDNHNDNHNHCTCYVERV